MKQGAQGPIRLDSSTGNRKKSSYAPLWCSNIGPGVISSLIGLLNDMESLWHSNTEML